jgi:hypothetical protein
MSARVGAAGLCSVVGLNGLLTGLICVFFGNLSKTVLGKNCLGTYKPKSAPRGFLAASVGTAVTAILLILGHLTVNVRAQG